MLIIFSLILSDKKIHKIRARKHYLEIHESCFFDTHPLYTTKSKDCCLVPTTLLVHGQTDTYIGMYQRFKEGGVEERIDGDVGRRKEEQRRRKRKKRRKRTRRRGESVLEISGNG